MIGTTLKKLLDEREIKVNEFARQIHVPAQTLYSIIRRDNMKIDFELLLRICDALHV
ncbi:helix-turn-helix domain-containing protein, partial [Hominenteromicrobium sp.]